jgi:hypothetical protein
MSLSPPFKIKDFGGEDTAATNAGTIYSHVLSFGPAVGVAPTFRSAFAEMPG